MSKLLFEEIKQNHHNHDDKDNINGLLNSTLIVAFYPNLYFELELGLISETTKDAICVVEFSLIWSNKYE